MANIKVAVRVRPISARELNLTGPEVVVRTDTSEIALTNLKVSSSKAGDSRERTRRYGFDYCFDSSDPEAENFADQARIYETLGQSVLDAVFSGYNSCLVAYGQSASGKTYTMMGTKEDPGLTPRLCEGLFSRIEDERKTEKTYCVSVSYLEIYNERVRDLLKPSSSTSGLRVREHPRLGPYVQGLTRHAVHTLGSLMSYVEEGTKARKTASTLQNPSSSRSHALLTIGLSAETPSVSVGASSGTCSSSRRSQASPHGGSKLRLVDLAGSESAATCSGVHRLKEGANINKSLVALGNVISALAERGSAGSGPGRRFIPYRDSSLTWLLKDALGGNATTIMLATISPARGSYNETAHTLRFAQRAQSVVNRPVVNEDPVARIIRELRAEVARLKSLLLEKNIEPETKGPCCCGKNQPATQADTTENHRQDDAESSTERLLDPETKSAEADPRTEDKESRNIAGIRRSNSIESLTTCDTSSALRRFGSCEFLAPADRFSGNYNRAKVTELKDEEGEIHDAVFVDIPTLVAVLIKPDDSLQERSAQIEEICSDEVAEDSIDAEFIDTNDRQTFEDAEKPDSVDHDDRSSSVNSCHASGDNDLDVYSTSSPSRADRNSRPKEKPKFRKQDSMDVLTCSVPSNLHISKKYGSVEAIEKRKEPIFSLERSHTNLEKRSVVPDRAKKLNNIREIDDQKICIRNTWRNSKEQLQRKGSNDSDKSLKESNGLSKWKNYARKPSLDNLKRKTSKDSSSSSSKDEQILISSLARDKLLRRKSSLEQEPPSIRAHTPIQRAKRSEIVAAVTERLYSSRKPADEASGIRSPTEASDMKSMAKMKLQEISRKMLGKRRRICVDTQTDSSRTIRMRDTASLTDTPQVVLQDVGVLTEDHEACQDRQELKTPVLRVKEIATLTDKPKTSIVRCKDVASLANDLEEFEYDVHSPRHDSGILSDDTQNYAESNLSSTEVSDLCQEDRRVNYAESSTNTVIFSPCRSFAVQTPRIGTSDPQTAENKSSRCLRQCCNSVQEPQSSSSIEKVEKSVISISLPDTISITIESSNVIESRIAVTDNIDPPEEKLKSDVKNSEVQTDETNDLCKEPICSKDFSRSTLSQTDNRVFRIENIFQDPNNLSKSSKADRTGRMRNSITFRNSLGTSYVSQPKEADVTNVGASGIQSEGFIRDGLITEAFITKKRNYNLKKPSSIVYENPWRNWVVPGTLNTGASIDYAKELGAVPSSWRHNETAMTDVTLSYSDRALENNSTFLKTQTKDSDPINANGTSEMKSSALELHSNMDHDHSFSDDSLDYNENNLSDSAMLKKKIDDHEQRENFCPPDVVAHTKKDSLKLSNIVDSENTEFAGDFEGDHVEFPKKKPSESAGSSQIHDYKSLILGVQCYSFKDKDEGDSASNEVHNSGKKKVSFSSVPESQVTSKQPSRSTLKSIIKKRRKKNHQEPSNAVQSSNDETDDSQQEDKDSLVSENDDPEETTKNQGSTDVTRDSKQSSRKKVKFLEEANACSESDSCENAEEDDENVSFDGTTRNILEEYLSEAVTFMRNLNSINEYVNAANMLERCSTPSQPVRSVRRGQRRRTVPSARNRDYVELLGRRVSLQDAADYLQDTEDVTMPTESYERCLKGIERLEDCIRRVDRHNELLREKYGVNCESAGARPSLASPSSDPDVPVNDAAVPRGAFVEVSTVEDQVGPRLDPKSKKNGDDLEKRIFDQLMSVANSSRYRASNKLRTRFSKRPESRSPSNLRGEPGRTTEEPIYGDVHGVLNLGVPDEDLLKDFAGYQITGNLSVEKSMENGRLNPLHEDHLKLSHSSWCRDRTRLDDSSKTDDDSVSVCFGDSCDRNSSKIHFPSRSVFADKYEEPEDYSRQVRDDTKVCACLRDHSTAKSSMDVPRNDTVNFRDKLKYPGSPRARFLELLRERRRIVESSRGTSVS